MNDLPPNPDAIAFDSNGTAFIGTQCDGLAVATPKAIQRFSSRVSDPFPIEAVRYKPRLVVAPRRLPWAAYGSGFDPIEGYRRDAAWDDHGETYAAALSGVGIWFRLVLPPGPHKLSLYFLNDNGHQLAARQRDYVVTVKRWLGSERAMVLEPALARCRVAGFYGGVYESFVTNGPGPYVVIVHRNHSFNTMLAGIFVDRLRPPRHRKGSQQYPFISLSALPRHP
ncbi:MAG: hypothetical protein ACP5I8_16315, partial [Phycisphaerae bacterium]